MSVFLPIGKIKVTSAKLPPTSVFFVLGITLLTVACTTEPSKQTASIDSDTTVFVVNKGTVICRYEAVTGSILKKEFCYTKKKWDTIDKRNKSSAEELVRTIQDHSATSNTDDALGGGGRGNNPTTPGF